MSKDIYAIKYTLFVKADSRDEAIDAANEILFAGEEHAQSGPDLEQWLRGTTTGPLNPKAVLL